MFAIRCGGFDIDAITTVFGNCPVPTGTRNALHLLELTAGMTVADFRPNRQEPADITVCTNANGKAILDWYENVLRSA